MAAKSTAKKASRGYTVVKDWREGVDMLACERCEHVVEDEALMLAHVEEHVAKEGGRG